MTKLPREPGKRESRFAHLFGGEIKTREAEAPVQAASAGPDADTDRIEQLEKLVNQLRDEMATLKARLDRFSPGQDPDSK